MGVFVFVILYTVIILVIGIVGDRLWTLKQRKYFKEDIKEKYGRKLHYKKGKEINREEVECYFKKVKNEEDFSIDNITWHDLNMDEIFKLMSNVQSSIGREVLYKMLRIPLFNKEKLDYRNRVIEFFRSEEKVRFKAQYIIRTMVGKADNANVTKFFGGERLVKLKSGLKGLLLLRYVALVLLILAILTGNEWFGIVFSIIIMYNITLMVNVRRENDRKDEDFAYLVDIIKCAFKIRELEIEEVNKEKDIDKYLNKFSKIKNGFWGDVMFSTARSNGILKSFMDTLFLSELIDIERVQNIAAKNPEAIRKIYEYVGEIDCFTGVASFRDVVEIFEKPEFMEQKGIEFKEVYNPIIENPVLNSIDNKRSILLTGSNASGKSTFLRSIGVNIILAQSFNMVCAKGYKGSMFRVMSSMALSDSIIGGESYYMVEIKSIKRILNNIDNDDYPIFCIVDEILRGTNTAERISAATGILKYFIKSGGIYCLAATHDIELTYILEGIYDNYSFEERVENNDIIFDYKLKGGRAKTRNAIKILEFIGYNEEIIEEANMRAESFLKNNNWTP